jgi:hypothetical protein
MPAFKETMNTSHRSHTSTLSSSPRSFERGDRTANELSKTTLSDSSVSNTLSRDAFATEDSTKGKKSKYTDAEWDFAKRHPTLAFAFLSDSKKADKRSAEWAATNQPGGKPADGTDANALKHAIWNGLMVRTAFRGTYGTDPYDYDHELTRKIVAGQAVDLAKEAADAHESPTTPKDRLKAANREMDFRNNQVGREVAREVLIKNPDATEEDIIKAIEQAYNQGRLYRRNGNTVVPAKPTARTDEQA